MIQAGLPFEKAKKVAILVHGRGSHAEQIITLSDHLLLDDFALLAPSATLGSWYPYSFMAPLKDNQPSLDKALVILDGAFQQCKASGFSTSEIFLIGFSQGACLSLEYAARNASEFGGVIAFTGGLIGEKIYQEHYHGNFNGSPIFIGASHEDVHVPLSRIKESANMLEDMGAKVNTLIFKDPHHTIREEEISWVNEHILC
ncbi:alpha/beta hydrolase [Pleomorphovibrio marinus]|uniref:alpha/beta hydrolase n=1 Tax=Pleomorphovibrio marinus TaxID=2164132 RepID=UPI000E0C6D41|nr:dienelactone hydrolase family protein [Pleomorphovibrio marinus]